MKIIRILLLTGILYCQATIDGMPKSFIYDTNNRLDKIVLPEIDIDQLLIEDSNVEPGTPFRYGNIFEVNYNLNNSGTWEILEDGSKLWRLEIKSEGAYSIGVEYDYFHIPDNSEFYVYDINAENIYGAYSSHNNQLDYLFSTPLVKGDVIILEYYEPSDAEFEGQIYLSEIIHDYKDIMNFFENENNNQRICATNTHGDGQICPEAEPYEMVINATSWLDMGGFICSGSMVNNTSYDLSKYYMTAWHCTNGDNPSTFRFYFNYGAYSCSSDNGTAGSSLYGSQLLATSNGMDADWTLLKITQNIPDHVWDSWEVFFAGWNRSTENPTISCAIHHPNGSPKRINFDDDIAISASWNQGDPGTHWRVFWDNGGTQGGSSGCPLYDENFRLVGVLSGGPELPCGDTGSYDLYGKFDRAWNDVKQWLDPGDTGAMYVDGTYDGSLIIEGCTDPDAENYDSNANSDDGSCFYGLADIYFGDISLNNMSIMTLNSAEIAQFEFTISDSQNLISYTNASGGLAEDNDFLVTVSDGGLVIGTSISDNNIIPVGEGILTNINYTFANSGTTEICITNQSFLDINDNEILVPGNSCYTIELDTELSNESLQQNLNFELQNIYPNPFNPNVNFDLQIVDSDLVEINVYDLKGNKVFEIFSGYLNSGIHSFNWEAVNFPTGIYILNSRSNNFVSNQKVLLMK